MLLTVPTFVHRFRTGNICACARMRRGIARKIPVDRMKMEFLENRRLATIHLKQKKASN